MSEDVITENVSEETEQSTGVVETTSKYTQEQTDSYIKKLRSENEKLRKESEARLTKEQQAKKEALAEQGKYKELYEMSLKDAETAKNNLVNVEKKNALTLALTNAGAKYPELLESSFKEDGNWNFDLDESGKIQNFGALLDSVKKNYKSLFVEKVLVGDGAPKVDRNQGEKSLDQQIAEAQKENNLAEVIRLKNQKLFENKQ